MYEICFAVGIIGGALAPSFYHAHTLGWAAKQSTRIREEHDILAREYQGKTSPSDVENFLKKAKNGIKEAKKRAMSEGRFIPLGYRKTLYGKWDEAASYLDRLDRSKDTTDVHYKVSNLFEEMLREKREALKEKREMKKAQRRRNRHKSL